jgi:hypothetical protein
MWNCTLAFSDARLNRLGGGALGGARRGRPFEQPAHVEGVVDLLHRDPPDEIAVADDAVQIPFLPEPGETLADGRSAHPMFGGQTHFRKWRARPISSFDNAGLQAAIRALDMGGIDLGTRGTRTGFHDDHSLRGLRGARVYRSDPDRRKRNPVLS